MIGYYQFSLTCRECGALLEHRASGESTGSFTQAIAGCTECATEYLIRVAVEATNLPARNRRMPFTGIHPVVMSAMGTHNGRRTFTT